MFKLKGVYLSIDESAWQHQHDGTLPYCDFRTQYHTLLERARRARRLDEYQTILHHPDVDPNFKSAKTSLKPFLPILADDECLRVRTPLYYACYHGDVKVLRILLAHPKVDVNAPTQEYGLTALSVACLHGRDDVVRELLLHHRPNAFGPVDVNKDISGTGNRPLFYAVSAYARSDERSDEIARLLLRKGADPDLIRHHPLLVPSKQAILERLVASENDRRRRQTVAFWAVASRAIPRPERIVRV